MSSVENNFNSTSEKKIRFRPDAHILFNNDNRHEETHDYPNTNEQESKKKGNLICKILSKHVQAGV